MEQISTQLFPSIHAYIERLAAGIADIPPDRQEILLQIRQFVAQQAAQGKSAELIFICTHNSRRSHFGQIWAKVLADFYGFAHVKTYSGGTEATAFHPNAIDALRSVGFEILPQSDGSNPHYKVSYGSNIEPIEAWSKVFSDEQNPQADFCAIMTCSEADEACPYVPGAAQRIALPFIDPKVSDGTPQQAETYALRCQQIATELAFVFGP